MATIYNILWQTPAKEFTAMNLNNPSSSTFSFYCEPLSTVMKTREVKIFGTDDEAWTGQVACLRSKR